MFATSLPALISRLYSFKWLHVFHKTSLRPTAKRNAEQAKTINKLISSKQFSINFARECSPFTNNRHLSEMPMQFLTSDSVQGCHVAEVFSGLFLRLLGFVFNKWAKQQMV